MISVGDVLLSLVFFLLGAALSFAVLSYQERYPELRITCTLPPNEIGDTLMCVVENTGRGETRDLHIGFNRILPIGTVVISPPELGAEIVPSTNPADPRLFEESSHYRRAFAVRIPRVAPKARIEFTLTTTDQDNQRTARQSHHIRKEIRQRLRAFGELLLADHPEYEADWNVDTFMEALAKRDCLFSPGRFTYEEGSLEVEFLTHNELLADALVNDLTKLFESQYSHVFKKPPRFLAPVVKIATAGGEKTYASIPPFVQSNTQFRVSPHKLRKGKPVAAPPAVPAKYDWQGSA